MKKTLLIILALCISIPVFAQHQEVYKITDFSKLLSSHVSPYVMPKNAASEALNVRASDSLGSLSKRTTLDEYGTIGSISVTSLHRLYKADDTAYLIVTGDTDIYLGSDSNGTFQTISDNETTGLRFDWITYKDNAIGCNGTDPCIKYDGHENVEPNTTAHRTANNVVAEFGAPYAQLLTGANLDASSWYQYKIQFTDTDTSTTYFSTRLSNPILTGADVRDITLTDIPLGKSGIDTRQIYRTEGQASEAALAGKAYKLVDTIANNTATTFPDTVADGSLTTAWDETSRIDISPPIGQFIQIHRDRSFIGNAPSLNSYFYWSEASYPEFFSAANYDYVRIDDGDEITFLETITGRLAIGKTNSITNFETQNVDSSLWRLYTISFVGCPAPWSVSHTPSGIAYLGWDGIYIYNAERSQLISETVKPEVKDVLQSNLDEVAGMYANNEYNLSYTSIESGEFVNNRVLIYDMVEDAYSIDIKNVNTFAYFNSGNDYGTLYYGSSKSDGKVLAEATDVSTLIFRYKSDFDAGTKDSIVIAGSENDPELSIGWGIVINDETSLIAGSNMSAVTLDSVTYESATVNRPGTNGYWYSAATQLDANLYEKLYWNEQLGASGDITLALRSGATAAAAVTGNFSSEFTDSSGADVSGETPNDFIQLRASLTTSDIKTTPLLINLDNFNVKLLYSKVGSAAETAINSVWESGYHDLGSPTIPKRIWGITAFYTGTLGTMTFSLENERGDIDQSFDIDLSIDPDSFDDQYFGNNTNKIYKWLAPVNSETHPTPIGRLWKFTIEEGGISGWNVYGIEVKYSQESYYED